MKPIRLAIADDEVLFRKGMRMLLGDADDIDVLFEAENGNDLLQKLAAAETLPTIILLDLNMPELNGIDATKILKKEYPEIAIIVLSTHFSKGIVFSLIQLGVSSYLAKNTEPDEVEQTIREVAKSGFFYNAEIQQIIRENFVSKQKPHFHAFNVKLTKRELEVLQLICEQHTNAEIAKKLYISARTVEGHRNNLLTKLDCRNSAGLVAYAIQNNLVTIRPAGF